MTIYLKDNKYNKNKGGLNYEKDKKVQKKETKEDDYNFIIKFINHFKCCCFTAAAFAQKYNKLAVINNKIYVFNNRLILKLF